MGGELAWTDIFVTHSGSDQSPAGRRAKCERDLRILEKDLIDRPEHPFVLFNFGMTYSDMEEYEKAVPYLKRSVQASQPHESHVRKLYALLVAGLAHLEQLEEAWDVCQEGRAYYPEDSELLFRQALLEHQLGRHRDAVQSYEQILYGQREERHFSSMDHGITGYKARHNLALVYLDMQRPDLAELQWRHALAEQPDFGPAHRGLGQCLLQQRRLATLKQQIALIPEQFAQERLLLHAEATAIDGDMDAARQQLGEAIQLDPANCYAREVQCRILFDRGRADEVEEALNQLGDLCPVDPSVFHNLGTVKLNQGRAAEAVADFTRSLELRPNSEATQQQLESARRALEANDLVTH